MAKRLWTDAEVETIRQEYPEGDLKELMTVLNRTSSAIAQKAFSLGVVRKYPCGRKGVKKDKQIPATRFCTRCQIELELSCFYPLKHGKHGRHSICSNCLSLETQRRLKRERDILSKRYVSSLIGIDSNQLPEALFELKKQHILIHRELERQKK